MLGGWTSAFEIGSCPGLQPTQNRDPGRVETGPRGPRSDLETAGDTAGALSLDLRPPQNLGQFGRQGGKEPAETTLDKIIEFPVKVCIAVRAASAAWPIASARALARRQRPGHGNRPREIVSHRMPTNLGGAATGTDSLRCRSEPAWVHGNRRGTRVFVTGRHGLARSGARPLTTHSARPRRTGRRAAPRDRSRS
jgi:hypothetical protein